jgi:hypothetical protein
MISGITHAMIYKPGSGAFWDPSILYHEGKYYLFSMYKPDQEPNHHVWSAVSDDGVHWKDVGIVITSEGREVNDIWKPFIAKVGDRFILNHGALSKPGVQNQCVFWESKDLRHWIKLYESEPDPKWYTDGPGSRWDAMYTLPKEEGNPKAGYWGYITATVNEQASRKGHMEGMLESKDGVHWKPISPPIFDFGKFDRAFFDVGGVERIGDKYYFIGGGGQYNGVWQCAMYTFVGDSPTGPFRADPEAFRLSGNSGGLPGSPHTTSLGAWARDKDGNRLISNYGPADYNMIDGGTVYMYPLKKAVVDKDKHLRLAYWTPNDAARGSSLSLGLDQCMLVYPVKAKATPEGENKQAAPGADCRVMVSKNGAVLEPAKRDPHNERDDRPMLALLGERFDLDKGIVLEGSIQIEKNTWVRPCSGGFYIEDATGSGTAIMMEVGHPAWRRTRIGRMTIGDKVSFDCVDETGPGCATVTGLDNGRKHSFRLWLRKKMVELYIDDMYMQTFVVRNTTGMIGFNCQNGKAAFGDLKVWQMSL